MMQPLVSVMMPVYNGEKFIAEAVKSIIDQTYSNWELVIVNDGSTDNTPEVLSTFTDQRIRIIHHEKNQGIVAARNTALKQAKGEYLAVLDSDDVAYPARLSDEVEFLEKNKDFALVGGSCITIDPYGNKGVEHRMSLPDSHIPVILFFSNYFIHSSVMFRKLPPEYLYYSAEFPPAEDFELFTRLSREFKLGNLEKVLVKYRLHGENTSVVKVDQQRRSIGHIFENQLKRLGAEFTPEEIDLHVSLAHGPYLRSRERIARMDAWLGKLVRTNEVNKCCNEHLFLHYSALFFRQYCQQSGLGLYGVNYYFNCSWAKRSKLRVQDKLKFIIKSFLAALK